MLHVTCIPDVHLQEPAPAFSSTDSLAPAPPRARRPILTQLVQAALIALHVPVSFFLPLAAIIYSLRSIAWFVGTALAAETKRQSSSETLGVLHHINSGCIASQAVVGATFLVPVDVSLVVCMQCCIVSSWQHAITSLHRVVFGKPKDNT